MLRVMMTGRSSSAPGDVIPTLPGLPPAPCPGCCPGVTSPSSPPFFTPKQPSLRVSSLLNFTRRPPRHLPPSPWKERRWLCAFPVGFTIPGTSCAACHRSRPFPPPIKQTRSFRGAPSAFLYLFLFLCRCLPQSLGRDLGEVQGDSGRVMEQPRGHSEGNTFGLHWECQWLGKGGSGTPEHRRMHPRIPRPSGIPRNPPQSSLGRAASRAGKRLRSQHPPGRGGAAEPAPAEPTHGTPDLLFPLVTHGKNTCFAAALSMSGDPASVPRSSVFF